MDYAVFYTQQAILIGSTFCGDIEGAGGTNALVDCRRFRNYLKNTLKYEITLLENPEIEDIKRAIEQAKTQMNKKYKQCKLLIYFSGAASRYQVDNEFGLKVHLSEDNAVDLRVLIHTMNDLVPVVEQSIEGP